MRCMVSGFMLVVLSISTFAADEQIAANVVKKYSEAIACQIQEVRYQPYQHKDVKVVAVRMMASVILTSCIGKVMLAVPVAMAR
jgi:hypothetical protein